MQPGIYKDKFHPLHAAASASCPPGAIGNIQRPFPPVRDSNSNGSDRELLLIDRDLEAGSSSTNPLTGMEVRVRRSGHGEEEGGGGRIFPPPYSTDDDPDGYAQREPRSSSPTTTGYAPQMLVAPGGDHVFAYRSGTTGPPTAHLYAIGSSSEQDTVSVYRSIRASGGGGGGGKGREEEGEGGGVLPSDSDILRGSMRSGAGVFERTRAVTPSFTSSSPSLKRPSGSSVKASMPVQAQARARRGSKATCGLHLAPGDPGSIALLLVLYTLQGIPMGLSASVPFLLTERVSYKQQALFSLASLPFSFKLLWAPVVDSTSFWGLGRRKAWLLPVQFLCGMLMLLASPLVGRWVGEGGPQETPDVPLLTAYFFVLYALMATQDIAVDGWALTMLSRENVGLASTCNTIGQTLGYFLAHVGFLALNSAETCNRFLRREPLEEGMVSLGGFLLFWGWIFLSTTLLVALKAEERKRDDDTTTTSTPTVKETYRQLWRILQLGPVRSMCLVLLTVKAGFAVTDAATNLKLIEYGMPKEEIALMSPLLILTGILVPVLLSKATSGPRPLSVFLSAFSPRLVVGLLYAGLLPLAHHAYGHSSSLPPSLPPSLFRLLFLTTVGLREVAANSMFISQMAFFARVSDPTIGGTYMTLLNTVSNLGSSWVRTASLAALDVATLRNCSQDEEGGEGGMRWFRWWAGGKEGGKEGCVVVLDGYIVQLLACTVVGVGWLLVFKPVLLQLQALRQGEWCLEGGREGGRGVTGSGEEVGRRYGGREGASRRPRESTDDEEKIVGGAIKSH
ncbi:acetyl-coenzyme a [Nannochloropsis oceanica]